jgi:hypothetical protein
MDKHEMALKTYEALQKRKKQKEDKIKRDIASCGWHGYMKVVRERQRNFY